MKSKIPETLIVSYNLEIFEVRAIITKFDSCSVLPLLYINLTLLAPHTSELIPLAQILVNNEDKTLGTYGMLISYS